MDSTDISGDGGVTKKILVEGTGDLPPKQKKVFVHYRGTFTDGKEFDSSIGGDPFFFTLGKGEVIKGWDLGVATMRKGEKAVLTIKPEYGYGSKNVGPIPGNSTLVFEVELIKFFIN